MIALNETITCEKGGNGIRSTVIMPGEVATDILKTRPKPSSEQDMARMLQTDNLADTVWFVAEIPPHVCLNEILICPRGTGFIKGLTNWSDLTALTFASAGPTGTLLSDIQQPRPISSRIGTP